MPRRKDIYLFIARVCRTGAKAVDHWPWLLIGFCVLSPISPHIRLPYALSYSDCSYFGGRGIVTLDDRASCDLVEVIDIRGRDARWAL